MKELTFETTKCIDEMYNLLNDEDIELGFCRLGATSPKVRKIEEQFINDIGEIIKKIEDEGNFFYIDHYDVFNNYSVNACFMIDKSENSKPYWGIYNTYYEVFIPYFGFYETNHSENGVSLSYDNFERNESSKIKIYMTDFIDIIKNGSLSSITKEEFIKKVNDKFDRMKQNIGNLEEEIDDYLD